MKHLKRFESNKIIDIPLNDLYDICIDIEDNSNCIVKIEAANGMLYSLKEIREGDVVFNFKRYSHSTFSSFKIKIQFKKYINYSHYIEFLNSYSFVEKIESYGWFLNDFKIESQHFPMNIIFIEYTFTHSEEYI